jgi:RHS repeat-associated protein
VSPSYTYDPYGVTTETTSSGAVANPWRYTGQYQDASTGLYKVGARYYQPELGRWTQQDPSGQDANAYLYVAGNPINFVDPSGLSETCVGETIAGAAAGAITGAVVGAAGGPAAPGGVIGLALLGGAGAGLNCAFNNLFESF